MKDIKLQDLLEAGCHFGHRTERWHPKADVFIYGKREGIHIIDLAKTKENLQKAAEYIKNLGALGKKILFVATKRQAKGAVREAAKKGGIAYLTSRWIGGLMTNWDEVKKNIEKLNRLKKESIDGSWSKFPKHEIVALEKTIRKLEMVYGGIADITALPEAIFIIDIKKELSCLKEALKVGLKTVAIVDTNTNPVDIDYPIPANDDAVGSIQFIVNYLTEAYIEGKNIFDKLQKSLDKVNKVKSLPEEIEEKVLVEKKEEVNKDIIKIKKEKISKKKPSKTNKKST